MIGLGTAPEVQLYSASQLVTRPTREKATTFKFAPSVTDVNGRQVFELPGVIQSTGQQLS